MKKLITLLLILVMAFSFTACGSTGGGYSGGSYDDGSYDDGSNDDSSSTCYHSWNDADCTTPKTCSYCGETSGYALGHTITTGTCSRCGENFSAWELGEFVDEFKQPTGDKYISTTVTDGSFSNSATTNSELAAGVQVTSTTFAIMLWRYGSSLVKASYSETYSITVLDQYGTRHYFTGYMPEDGFRIYVYGSDKEGLLNILRQPGEVSFYLETSKYTLSTYLFTIDATGFAELYAEL